MLKPEKKTGEQGHSHSSKRVSCNGGGGALGHPLIWLTYGQDGNATCPYCSKNLTLKSQNETRAAN